MNREAIENLVIEATRRTDKVSLIRSAINIAVEEVSSQRLWSDLMTEATVALAEGEGSVDLASDVARIVEIRVMDGLQSQPLEVRPKTWLITRVPDPSSHAVGRPCHGYLEGTTLHVLPWADDDYDLNYTYFRRHPELSASTDEVLIRCASSAVVSYAIYWVFKSIEKHEDAREWMASYGHHLASAIKVDKANSVVRFQADEHGTLGRYPGSYWLDPFAKEMP